MLETDVLHTSTLDCGAVTLHVTQIGPRADEGRGAGGGTGAGADAGEPVLFLHGFPELARFWWPVMKGLATHHRCAAPDQRGFGDSGRPADPDDYGVDALLADIEGLLDRLAWPRVHLVGHDWGGVLAWWFAARHPQRVHRLAVFNAPHPAALQQRLLQCTRQRAASAYLQLLQRPGTAAALRALGPEGIWQRLHADITGFDAEDHAAYLQAFSARDALEGPTAWYRCSPFVLPPDPTDTHAGIQPPVTWHLDTGLRVQAETLIAWGQHDTLFVPELADDSAAWATRARVVRFADGGHNLPRQHVGACVRLLHEFLGAPGTNT